MSYLSLSYQSITQNRHDAMHNVMNFLKGANQLQTWAIIEFVTIQMSIWILKQLQMPQIVHFFNCFHITTDRGYKMNSKSSCSSYHLPAFMVSSVVKTTFTCSLGEVEDLDFLRYDSKSQIMCHRYDAIRHTLPTIQTYLPLNKQSIVGDYLFLL